MKFLRFSVLILFISPLFQQSFAIDLDGVSDHIQIPGGSELLANSTELTMSGWIYPRNYNSDWPSYDGYFGLRNELDADFYLLQLSDFNVECRMRNSQGELFTFPTSANSVQMEVWQHLALTYNGSELTAYINGVQAGSTFASGEITNTFDPFYIGTVFYQTTAFNLNGMVDDVRIWSRALSAEEIQEYMNQDVTDEEGLTAYWKMNEGTGSTAYNSITDNYHGTFVGTPEWTTEIAPVEDAFCGIPGDVNEDDSIDVTDIVTIVSAIISENLDDVMCADMNEDGTVNVQDIVLIINYILGTG